MRHARNPRSDRSSYRSSGQLRAKLRKGVADRLERIGVVRVGRVPLSLEIWPLVVHAAPLGVGLSNEFAQHVLRTQHLPDIAGQDGKRPLIIAKEDLTGTDLAEDDRPKRAPRINEVASQVSPNLGLGLIFPSDGRLTLQCSTAGHSTDCFAQGELAPLEDFSLDL